MTAMPVYDIGRKKAVCERAGVPERDETLTSPRLPGCAPPLATVFGE